MRRHKKHLTDEQVTIVESRLLDVYTAGMLTGYASALAHCGATHDEATANARRLVRQTLDDPAARWELTEAARMAFLGTCDCGDDRHQGHVVNVHTTETD